MEGRNYEPHWPKYGLRSDPYFSGALLPDEAGVRPIHLFRARRDEVARLMRRIQNSDASVSTIIAEGGYGKTSLTSRIVHDLRTHYLMLPGELAFHHESPSQRFYFDLLDGIVRALIERGIELPKPPRDPSKDPEQRHPHILQALRLVALYRHSTGLQVGLNLGPFLLQTGGGQLVRPAYHPRQSRELLRRLFLDLKDHGIQGITVRMNNLGEPFLTGRSKTVQEFLHECRDLFQEVGYHFMLCGNRDLANMVESMPRVSTVFGPPTVLQDFSVEDVHEILRARYEHLANGEDYTAPATDALVESLHGIHHGDLRNILKDLRTAMELAQPVAGEPVDMESAMPLLQNHHLGGLGDLKHHDWEILEVLDNGPARSTDLAQQLDKTPGRISQITLVLRQADIIEECEGTRPGTYLRLTGRSHMAMRAREGE